LLKKSPNKENAIYSMEIVMADENEGPEDFVAQGWKALGLPIA
jgi:hypothetical protein